VLLRGTGAVGVWDNAIKMPDQQECEWEWISASYKMFGRGVEKLILSFNYLKFSIDVCGFLS